MHSWAEKYTYILQRSIHASLKIVILKIRKMVYCLHFLLFKYWGYTNFKNGGRQADFNEPYIVQMIT